jgi:predicted RND superfamily exporter protein
MNILVVGIGLSILVALIGLFVILKKSKKGEEEEVEKKERITEEEEEEQFLQISEEEEEGCPEEVKKQLLENQQKIFHDAHKVYLVINNLLKGKSLPPSVQEDLKTFMRAYSRLKEMKEEIEVYPFADCDKVFPLKFEFYQKIIKETAQKLMLVARTLK